MSDAREVLTLEETAEMLRLCTKTVLKLAKAGKLRGRQVNGPSSPWRFYRGAIVEFVNGKESTDGHRAA